MDNQVIFLATTNRHRRNVFRLRSASVIALLETFWPSIWRAYAGWVSSDPNRVRQGFVRLPASKFFRQQLSRFQMRVQGRAEIAPVHAGSCRLRCLFRRLLFPFHIREKGKAGKIVPLHLRWPKNKTASRSLIRQSNFIFWRPDFSPLGPHLSSFRKPTPPALDCIPPDQAEPFIKADLGPLPVSPPANTEL